MFKLVRPCVTCPFKRGTQLILREERIMEIINSPAFQCHKTVDYSEDEPQQGEHPQQCAGLMTMLYHDPEFYENTIMQVAVRLRQLDFDRLDPDDEAFHSVKEALAYHNNSGVRT